jgi:stage II sporulation protein R
MAWKKRLMLLIAPAAAIMAVMALCGAWKQEPLRLHIVANSDSEADQQIKMEVRDAVLKATQQGIEACENETEAEEYVSGHLEIIIETANAVLEEKGAGYRAQAAVGTYHFPDRTYQNVTYPEGDYRALRIILGEGRGHNWWCVMFPPLCISEITQEDAEYTSFFAELWEQWFGACP